MQLPTFTTGIIVFSAMPALGHVHVYRDQIYTLESIVDDKRFPLIWRTHCAVCGAGFSVTSGLKSNGFSRRCEKHKQKGVKIKQSTVHKAARGWVSETAQENKPMADDAGLFKLYTVGSKTPTGSIMSQGMFDRVMKHCEEKGISYVVVNNEEKEDIENMF